MGTWATLFVGAARLKLGIFSSSLNNFQRVNLGLCFPRRQINLFLICNNVIVTASFFAPA